MREIRPFITPEQVQAISRSMAKGFDQVRVQISVMADAYITAIKRVMAFTEEGRRHLLAQDRARIGGNGSDAYDPLWQSAVCSAWLHASCPDLGGKLECSCDCHRA